MENHLGGVGSGLTFKPSDAVAVSYLFNKQMGHPLRFDGWVIKKADLYGDKEPWELPGVHEKVGGFFFYTTLKKTTPSGRRYSRTVGKTGGTWVGYDKGQPIYHQKAAGGRGRSVIGTKKSFIYENKNNIDSGKSGVWSMKEYSVDGELLKQIKTKKSATNIQDDDDDDTVVLVLCQIQKNTSSTEEQNASLLNYYVAAAHHQCPQITTTTTLLDQELEMANDLFGVESGVTFSPSDAVAVCYLFNKQVGQPMRYDRWVIKQVDLYGDQEPWEELLGGGVDDEEVGFFYTNLKKKIPNAKHYCRTVGKSGGTWTRTDQGQPIYDQKADGGRVIGLKKGLVYQNKNNSSRSGCRWLMKEYSVDGDLLNLLKQIKIRNRSGSVRDDDDDDDDVLVLCQIKKKVIKRK